MSIFAAARFFFGGIPELELDRDSATRFVEGVLLSEPLELLDVLGLILADRIFRVETRSDPLERLDAVVLAFPALFLINEIPSEVSESLSDISLITTARFLGGGTISELSESLDQMRYFFIGLICL